MVARMVVARVVISVVGRMMTRVMAVTVDSPIDALTQSLDFKSLLT